MGDSGFRSQEREQLSSHKGPPDKPNKPDEMLDKKEVLLLEKNNFVCSEAVEPQINLKAVVIATETQKDQTHMIMSSLVVCHSKYLKTIIDNS
jgi:hypothetical protein